MSEGGLSTHVTLDSNDYFGSSVASVGDYNGDGIPDLAVGAYGDDDGGSVAGAVYILFMTTSGTVSGVQKISMLEGDLSTHVSSRAR